MQESLRMLFQLQEIDQRLHELERLKFDIPERIGALDRKDEEISTRLKAAQEQLEALQKERRQQERDLQAAQDQIKKYMGQLLQVKTNKEYDAMQHEIAVYKIRIGEHEDAILKLMEAAETASQTLEEMSREATAGQEECRTARTQLQERLSAIDDDVAVRLDERKRMAMKIEIRVVQTYDRVCRGHQTDAVVYLKKGACGGCYRVIPLQVIAEIRKMTRVITCEACGRILATEPELG